MNMCFLMGRKRFCLCVRYKRVTGLGRRGEVGEGRLVRRTQPRNRWGPWRIWTGCRSRGEWHVSGCKQKKIANTNVFDTTNISLRWIFIIRDRRQRALLRVKFQCWGNEVNERPWLGGDEVFDTWQRGMPPARVEADVVIGPVEKVARVDVSIPDADISIG